MRLDTSQEVRPRAWQRSGRVPSRTLNPTLDQSIVSTGGGGNDAMLKAWRTMFGRPRGQGNTETVSGEAPYGGRKV